MSDTDPARVLAALQRIWGYPAFRHPQEEIARALLNGEDAIVVMPTGGGKSIAFQLPALLQTGLTLVICPLIALMEDQVRELRRKNLPAGLLHSETGRQRGKKILDEIARNRLRLLYLSPETLLSPTVWEKLTLPSVGIDGLILDEAHCLVEWGDRFRPAYSRLGTVRPALSSPPPKKIAIAAFTATANPATRETLARVLRLRQPKLFLHDPYRDNIDLKTEICFTPRCRRHRLWQFLRERAGRSGLIYTRSRRESENLATWLESEGHDTRAYHAGLSPPRRREIESRWLEGDLPSVICTSAFGMGIDKADVRWIVHYHAPYLLSEYVQETGRGGRDGGTMEALTLVSEPTGWSDNSDRRLRDFFAARQEKLYRRALQISRQIPREGKVESVEREFTDGALSLALLHGLECLEWLDPFHYRLIRSPRAPGPARGSHDEMFSYLHTRQCRWRFLLHSFGFTERARDFRCGHCDNCRKGTRRL